VEQDVAEKDESAEVSVTAFCVLHVWIT
jgi:hypothetical protein